MFKAIVTVAFGAMMMISLPSCAHKSCSSKDGQCKLDKSCCKKKCDKKKKCDGKKKQCSTKKDAKKKK